MNVKERLTEVLAQRGTTLDTCSNGALCQALLVALRAYQQELKPAQGQKKLYYFSAEFLVGRLLRANLINLGLEEEVEALLRPMAGPWPRWKTASRSPPWATAAWAAWPPASWTPSPRWACPATAWASTTTTASSART